MWVNHVKVDVLPNKWIRSLRWIFIRNPLYVLAQSDENQFLLINFARETRWNPFCESSSTVRALMLFLCSCSKLETRLPLKYTAHKSSIRGCRKAESMKNDFSLWSGVGVLIKTTQLLPWPLTSHRGVHARRARTKGRSAWERWMARQNVSRC